MAEQSVTLQPGKSTVVSFEATPHEAKTYQVSVSGLTGSFVAVTPRPAMEVLESYPTPSQELYFLITTCEAGPPSQAEIDAWESIFETPEGAQWAPYYYATKELMAARISEVEVKAFDANTVDNATIGGSKCVRGPGTTEGKYPFPLIRVRFKFSTPGTTPGGHWTFHPALSNQTIYKTLHTYPDLDYGPCYEYYQFYAPGDLMDTQYAAYPNVIGKGDFYRSIYMAHRHLYGSSWKVIPTGTYDLYLRGGLMALMPNYQYWSLCLNCLIAKIRINEELPLW